MRKALIAVAVLLAGILVVGWWVTVPAAAPTETFAEMQGDAAAGETVFWAAGCASCHSAPDSDDTRVLAGGHELTSPYGTFVTPNISPDPTYGIGGWTLAEFANAVKNGVSPDGRHYYPAFPYTAYARMTDQDIADLKAFMDTLPMSDAQPPGNDVAFPYSIRRSLGVWKALFLDDAWVMPAETDQIERGRYLVEAMAHCGECHTPRGQLGNLQTERWLAGGPNPSGDGQIPNITPAALDWSASDIAYYLESGFTPSYDSAGGSMASVVDTLSRLTSADREAIAAYVKGVPSVPDEGD